jgi:hypothetical protein
MALRRYAPEITNLLYHVRPDKTWESDGDWEFNALLPGKTGAKGRVAFDEMVQKRKELA